MEKAWGVQTQWLWLWQQCSHLREGPREPHACQGVPQQRRGGGAGHAAPPPVLVPLAEVARPQQAAQHHKHARHRRRHSLGASLRLRRGHNLHLPLRYHWGSSHRDDLALCCREINNSDSFRSNNNIDSFSTNNSDSFRSSNSNLRIKERDRNWFTNRVVEEWNKLSR